ncbi:MAG: hypothetical protein E7340_05940 [Clostridiales bacterium]|nr:hypothetical protein [Clostridiales bacterium]
MLDWMFEGIVDWVSGVVTDLMDAVSGLFLNALGTDMTAMEEYFPFVASAFTVMQYMAWALLFLITVWQLFKAFSGPLGESENPWTLIFKSALFALLIYFAKPIFLYILNIAKAPYTALMDVVVSKEHFTFAGIEGALRNGLTNFISMVSVVGEILILILIIALGWNYFKLLLEVVERYIVVGVLCYTSPLAYSMGASQSTSQVFKSWCRMVGSQLLLLIMNVWFLRAFNSSVGHYVGAGGALTNGHGSVFLWLFCALAFLKTAQRFDAYLASIGLNVAQTGTGLGFELLMAARLVTSGMGGFSRAGNVFGSGAGGVAAAGGAGGFFSRFKGNSFVRDSVVQGGTRMGAGGAIGVVGRAFGGVAARNGATLTGESIASVAGRHPSVSGTIGGDIANKSLGNYMPHLKGKTLSDTQITGGKISTTAIGTDGKQAALSMYSAEQFEKPSEPHSIVTATDGSKWYQTASGAGAGEYNDLSGFQNGVMDSGQVSTMFPGVENGTVLRSVGDGVVEASNANGNTLWYNSAYFDEPDAPHSTLYTENGVAWYAMNPNAEMPSFESGSDATDYNIAQFQNFMPGYEGTVTSVSEGDNGRFEIRHEDGSGTRFYDSNQYETPRNDYTVYEDNTGHQWYAVDGTPAVERRPVYENGEPVYNGDNVRTVSVETVRYRGEPSRFGTPKSRTDSFDREPRRKR